MGARHKVNFDRPLRRSPCNPENQSLNYKLLATSDSSNIYGDNVASWPQSIQITIIFQIG